jgi:hypothetical protein
MAMRKMTFTIPEEVVGPFLRAVPSTRRSKFATDALRRALKEREDALIAACDAVNADPEIAELEREMDALSGDGLEDYPWEEPATR